MKPLQLALTVLLVAGGIFIYDPVVRDPAAPPSPQDGDFEPLHAHAEDADDEPDLRLDGLGHEPWREETERRLASLEERPTAAGRTTVVRGSGARGAATGGLDFAEGALDEALEVADADGERGAEDDAAAPGSHEPIDPVELADFRRKLEAVERQRRLQRSVRTISGALRRMWPSHGSALATTCSRLSRWLEFPCRTVVRGGGRSSWSPWSDHRQRPLPPATTRREERVKVTVRLFDARGVQTVRPRYVTLVRVNGGRWGILSGGTLTF